MKETTPVVEVAAGQPPASGERRKAERIPCDLETACQPVAGRGETAWPAKVRNISRSGIALELNRRFERGTLLSVQLEDPAGAFTRTMFARVVNVRAQADDAWVMGCAFAGELSADDLPHFQVERRRPSEHDCRAWVRFDCDLPATAFLIREDREETMAVRVVNVSPGGMGLHAPHLVATGTFLLVELPSAPGQPERCLEVRVIKVARHESQGWMLGCELAAQLGPDELRTLANPPTA